jgi:membrane-associated phospholipid phosphatase
VFRGLTWLADEKLMVVGAVVAWLGIRALSSDRTFGRMADQMLCAIAITAALPHVVKLAFVRERPDRTRVGKRRKGIPKSGNAWDSFPSGHAVHVGALAASASRMTPRHAGLIWSSALALIGTRVLLLAHHLTDVMLAACSV